MAADKIVAHVEAVASFVEQLSRNKASAAKVLEAQCQAMTTMLSGATLTVAEASAVAAAIHKVPWSEADRSMLLGLVVDRSAGTSAAAFRSQLQDFAAISSYLSSAEWGTLLAERTPAAQKLNDLVAIAVRLQLRHPSEGTYQVLTAMFLMCSEGSFSKAMNLSPQVKLSSLQHVKKVFKAAPKPPASEMVDKLPLCPGELRKKRPALYKVAFASDPVQCPLCQAELEALTNAIPMRTTSKLLAGVASPPSCAPGQPQDVLVAMLGALSKLMKGGGGAETGNSLLNLTMLPRHQRALMPEDLAEGEEQGVARGQDVTILAKAKAKASPAKTLTEDGGESGRAPVKRFAPILAQAQGEGGDDEHKGEEHDEVQDSSAGEPQAPRELSQGSNRKRTLSVSDTTDLIRRRLMEKAQQRKKELPATRKNHGKKDPAQYRQLATGPQKNCKKDQTSAKKVPAASEVTGKKVKAKSSCKQRLPFFSVEWSRNQVMCRGAPMLKINEGSNRAKWHCLALI